MLNVAGLGGRGAWVPVARRCGRGAALLLAYAALVLSVACRSDGEPPAEPAPTSAVRATPAPDDGEMRAQVYQVALSLRAAVADFMADLQAGADTEESWEQVSEVCKDAATLFRDANMEGVVKIRETCREINTRGQTEDLQFWRTIRAELDALVEEYRDARQSNGGS